MGKVIGIFVMLCVALGGYKVYQGTKARMEHERIVKEQAEKTRMERERAESERRAFQEDEATLTALLERWDSQVKLASSTPRIALAAQVAPLQALNREASAISFKSKCYSKTVQDTLTQGMQAQIDGFIAFMSQSEATASKYLELSRIAFEAVGDVRDNCKQKLAS